MFRQSFSSHRPSLAIKIFPEPSGPQHNDLIGFRNYLRLVSTTVRTSDLESAAVMTLAVVRMKHFIGLRSGGFRPVSAGGKLADTGYTSRRPHPSRCKRLIWCCRCRPIAGYIAKANGLRAAPDRILDLN